MKRTISEEQVVPAVAGETAPAVAEAARFAARLAWRLAGWTRTCRRPDWLPPPACRETWP